MSYLSDNVRQITRFDRFVVLGVLVVNAAVLAYAVIDGNASGDPGRKFAESSYTTWISSLQLLTIAVFAFGVYWYRFRDVRRIFSVIIIWFLIGVGFTFLAADEKFLFHENLDKKIHAVTGMTETAWSDRIDDLIVLLYGLIGIAALWCCRHEVLRFPYPLRYLYGGFALLLLMVILDVASNGDDFILALGIGEHAVIVTRWLGAIEDVCKIMAEAFFLAGFFLIFMIVRRQSIQED